MITSSSFRGAFVSLLLLSSLAFAQAQSQIQNTETVTPQQPTFTGGGFGDNPPLEHKLPDALKGWDDWVLWDDDRGVCPTPYNDSTIALSFWPSQLNLQATDTGAQFQLSVSVLWRSWIALPGDEKSWPLHVMVNGQAVPVLPHGPNGSPSIQLIPGKYQVSGSFTWPELPPRLFLPDDFGILALTLNGKPVNVPSWGTDGYLIFQQTAAPQSEKDFIEVKVFRVMTDGVPIDLQSEVVLNVSGRSREENLHCILPEGWRLNYVTSPLPVAIDASGNAKVQVRPGKWTLSFNAYSLSPQGAIGYASTTKPAVEQELIGFVAKPELRLVKINDVPTIDVTQTDFPSTLGTNFPVYRWTTSNPFHLEETLRGMGAQQHDGLTITRSLWLDDAGDSIVYQDSINASNQERWRLDSAADHLLGSVNTPDGGLLITKKNHVSGVELRSANLALTATGLIPTPNFFTASGWNADADSLSITLDLPPGWRLFAAFGPDTITGAWLTSWTLLDLFLLMLFALAIGRVWGLPTGLIALVALGLAYREPEAPRLIWLFLLPPLVILKMIQTGWFEKYLKVVKWIIFVPFCLFLAAFSVEQIEWAIYPQLEETSSYSDDLIATAFPWLASYHGMNGIQSPTETTVPPPPTQAPQNQPEGEKILGVTTPPGGAARPVFTLSPDTVPTAPPADSNLAQDEKAKVQTGPAVPQAAWRQVYFSWSGPVTLDQKVNVLLIPPWLQRLLSVVRVGLLIFLVAILMGARKFKWVRPSPAALKGGGTAMLLLGLLSMPAEADIPTDGQLNDLKARLTQASTSYPNAADIPQASVTIKDGTITTDLEVHAAIQTAVPVPGKLPFWSPLTVLVDGKPDVSLRRGESFLWVVVPPGVHQVEVTGMLPAVSEWAWTFLLKPHYVTVTAPDWTWTGLKADGSPDQQIFFSRKLARSVESDYGRQQVSTLLQLERHLELGQVWEVHNRLSRVGEPTGAVSLKVPLLPKEKVLSSTLIAKDGFVVVPLTASETEVTWDSVLPVPVLTASAPTYDLSLQTNPTDTWVETWSLAASPKWDVAYSGTATPTFETGSQDLSPNWHPWPGEKALLTIGCPVAVAGSIITINKVDYSADVGLRQLTCTLNLDFKCSIGQDFYIDIPEAAAISALTVNGEPYPARVDHTLPADKHISRLVVPLNPSSTTLSLTWKLAETSILHTRLPHVSFYHLEDSVVQPVPCANYFLSLNTPASRFIVWTWGPLRGPAVTLWTILAVAALAAYLLGRTPLSPLNALSWFLLAVGLSQVSLFYSVVLLSWFFLFAWRGKDSLRGRWVSHNLFQLFLLGITVPFLVILLMAVGSGLLGPPTTWIYGPGSDQDHVTWYLAEGDHGDNAIPSVGYFSFSIWWYRLAMLLWSLWLAYSVLQWLTWAVKQLLVGGFFAPRPKKPLPPLPVTS